MGFLQVFTGFFLTGGLELKVQRVRVSEREVCQKALIASVSSLYFMTCVLGWQSFSFDSTAIRSKISLGGR